MEKLFGEAVTFKKAHRFSVRGLGILKHKIRAATTKRFSIDRQTVLKVILVKVKPRNIAQS
ncbi:MAG: hypothetical protein MUF81_14250 [Verrucomicrobia bacterium]|nr:hypothetical protein [Verrucomicrobiota bacterium]